MSKKNKPEVGIVSKATTKIIQNTHKPFGVFCCTLRKQ